MKIQNIFKVVSNEKLCPKFHRLRVDAKPILKKVRPGQFISVRLGEGLDPFLRRPFSVYRAKEYVEILYEVVGPGTRALAAKRKGDSLDVLGPVGRPFRRPPQGVKQVVMIGGGIGAAPFLAFSDILKKNKSYEMILLYGGRSKDHVYPMNEFKKNGCHVHIATDDGSVGVHGRVSELFSKINLNPKGTFLYACGPRPMIKSVQDFAKRNSLRGEACCEETMACAVGTCLGCAIRTTSGYQTVCCDGPVFDLDEICI